MKNYETYFENGKSGNDLVEILVYVSEKDRQKEKISEITLSASKNLILSNISEIPEDLEEDVIFLKDNINDLKRVEIIIKGRSRIKIGFSTKLIWASEQFTDLIKKTIKDCNAKRK